MKYSYDSNKSDFISGIACIKGQKDWSLLDTRYILPKQKYDAYLWASNNISDDAIIAVDAFENGETNHLMAGAFSGHRMWNDEVYIINLYPNEQVRRQTIMNFVIEGQYDYLEVMKNEGVTHLLQNIDINSKFVLPSEYGQIIFENDLVRLYELN